MNPEEIGFGGSGAERQLVQGSDQGVIHARQNGETEFKSPDEQLCRALSESATILTRQNATSNLQFNCFCKLTFGPPTANRLAMKIRDVIKLVENDGWQMIRMKGDHRHYRHPTKSGIVTIAGHTGRDIKAGTLNSILKQAGLK